MSGEFLYSFFERKSMNAESMFFISVGTYSAHALVAIIMAADFKKGPAWPRTCALARVSISSEQRRKTQRPWKMLAMFLNSGKLKNKWVVHVPNFGYHDIRSRRFIL